MVFSQVEAQPSSQPFGQPGDAKDRVEAELVSELSQIEAGESFYVLLKQEIEPGWHTYWKNPGDSGAATALNWDLPDGFSASEIEWPYPERVPYEPLMNFGYHDQVLLPVKIQAPAIIDTEEITLNAKGKWLVCGDVCIPEGGPLSITLPVGKATKNPDTAELFASARQNIPQRIGVDAAFTVTDEKLVLFVEMSGLVEDRIESIDYFPFAQGVMDNPVKQHFRLLPAGFELTTKVGYNYTPDSEFAGIVVIKENSGESLATAFVVGPEVGGTAASSDLSLWSAMLLAFIGGLILIAVARSSAVPKSLARRWRRRSTSDRSDSG